MAIIIQNFLMYSFYIYLAPTMCSMKLKGLKSLWKIDIKRNVLQAANMV